MTKTKAAKETLTLINPDVEIESKNYNITSVDNWDNFLLSIKHGGKQHKPVDLVLGCVDNFEARVAINRACMEIGAPWMESGVSENAVSGHIQFIVPGQTACFECCPPLIVADGIDERTLKREGVCAASLPTTMSIVAAMLVQNALKYLLHFGTVSYYLGYNAMEDFFPKWEMKPNDSCTNSLCAQRQKEYEEFTKANPKIAIQEDSHETKIVHEANDWGITLVDENEDTEPSLEGTESLPLGVRRLYDSSQTDKNRETVVIDDNTAVEDLAAQLKALNTGV
eukprot:TRINITY_DN130_c0_g1_i2.p1 TRINITY_DN130_c0_g1~~TRINITY_DN130_c0_g1_i2.p1  ORF type:complete len:282 (+),score=39.48 TRINITY_DN130_c0_g1_i2:62-907(+)